MPTMGGASCQRGEAVLSVNDGVVLNTNEGGGSVPTRLTRGGGGGALITNEGVCSVSKVGCAQYQRRKVLNANYAGYTMPTREVARSQRGGALKANYAGCCMPTRGGVQY